MQGLGCTYERLDIRVVVRLEAEEKSLKHVSAPSIWADCNWDEYFVGV